MQSTNYPNHQHGNHHGRNTLTKPNPNANTVGNDYGTGNTTGATGNYSDNNNYSTTGAGADTGMGMGAGTTTGMGAGIPTSNATSGAGTRNTMSNNAGTIPSTDYPSLSAAKKEARVGKIETKVGKVLHSTSMKEKGIMHLEKAEAIENQHGSLKEAERLEGLANEARQRAEQHNMVVEAMQNESNTGPGKYAAARGA